MQKKYWVIFLFIRKNKITLFNKQKFNCVVYWNSYFRGAVDADGRIQPGDMILQMNDISFEHISNSDAVRLLRETVKDAK